VDFEHSFFLLLIVLPLILLWIFALADLVRQHSMPRAKRCAWFLLIILVPAVGAIIYVALRTPSEGQLGTVSSLEGSGQLRDVDVIDRAPRPY
jgi:hypothetical protein